MTGAGKPRPVTAILGFGRFGRAFSELLLDAGHEVRALDPRGPERARPLTGVGDPKGDRTRTDEAGG